MKRNAACVAATASLALLAAACGGGDTPSTGGSPGSRSAVAYSSCVRAHGVPNFPDPDSQGRLTISGGSGLNPGSAQFQSAQRQCAKYLPNGGQPPSPAQQAKMQAQALKFSQCMRSHGVPNFPDPQFHGGGISIKIDANSGINPRSPQFQAAQKACQADLPGKAGPAGGGKVTSGGLGTSNTAGSK